MRYGRIGDMLAAVGRSGARIAHLLARILPGVRRCAARVDSAVVGVCKGDEKQ